MHKQVLPFLLRRLKEDVLNDLPPKIIQDYYCDLSEVQKILYDDFSKSQAKMQAEDVIRSKGPSSAKDGTQQHVFQSLQYLRKLCNHPSLVTATNADAVSAALAKVGCAAGDLSDIHHAPKLQALRCVSFDGHCRMLMALSVNCSRIVVSEGDYRSFLILERQNQPKALPKGVDPFRNIEL